MDKAVKFLGYVLLAIGAAVVLAGLVGIWTTDGWRAALETVNPWNLWNFIATVVVLAPGILLIQWGEKLSARRAQRQNPSK